MKNIFITIDGDTIGLTAIKELNCDYNGVNFWTTTSVMDGIKKYGDKYKIYEIEYSRNGSPMDAIQLIYNHSKDYTAGVSYGDKGIDILRQMHQLINAYFSYSKKTTDYKVDKKHLLFGDLRRVATIKDYSFSKNKKSGELVLKIQTR